MPPADLALNAVGWRRVYKTGRHWLQTREVTSGQWGWYVWNDDKTKMLITGQELYSRATDAARGAKRLLDSMTKAELNEIG